MFVNFNILNQLGSPAINSNTFANRPAAGQTGRLFVSTDTFEIYRDNGTTWDLIGGPGSSTITGTGTATQVAYFTSSQAIGSSANLFWDNTNTRLGVGTAVPGYTIEANGSIKVNSVFLAGATGGSGALYWTSDRVTVANYNVGGIVVIETNGGPSAATFGADYTATFVSGIGTRGYTGSTSYGALFNGSVGINTATPGAALDVHSTGTIAQFNTTSATGNTYIAFQRTGTGLWRIGDTYNGGPNQFEIHNTVLGIDAVNIKAATNKTSWQATENYSSGVARGNYFDYNLTLNPANPLASPNAISAVGASLDLTLQGSIIIPSGARSGLDAYNSISFTTTGTLTHNQGTQIRAYSNLTAGWAFNGSATGTITHLAGLRALFPDNSGSAVNVTNNYALLLNDQTPNTGTVTYTNRWGVYQEGASDLNYMAANLLLGSTTNNGNKLQVTGNAYISGDLGLGTTTLTGKLNVSSGNAHLNSYFVTGTSAGWDINTYFTGGNAGSEQFIYFGYPTAETDVFIQRGSNGRLAFGTSATSRLTLDASGNLGLGVSPSAWYNTGNYVALQVGNASLVGRNSANSELYLGANVYINSIGNATYITSDFATRYIQNDGVHSWYTAPSGTAGSAISFTQAMTLDASGRLGIGTTSPSFKLQVSGGTQYTSFDADGENTAYFVNTHSGAYTYGAGGVKIQASNATSNQYFGAQNGALIMMNGSSVTGNINYNGSAYLAGNVLIGTTTDSGQKLQVAGNGTFTGSVYFGNQGTGNRGIYLGNVGTEASILYNASTGNLDISPRSGYSTFITTGNFEITNGSIKTVAPVSGTAAAWKLGSRVAATVALDTTQYIELDVGGTLYKLAIVT